MVVCARAWGEREGKEERRKGEDGGGEGGGEVGGGDWPGAAPCRAGLPVTPLGRVRVALDC